MAKNMRAPAQHGIKVASNVPPKVSNNIPRPPASQNVSESSKIKAPRAAMSDNIPMNTEPKGGSPNPSKASSPANLKNVFGTPKN